MSYVTFEVEIEQGQVHVKTPDQLPQTGRGLLTILQQGAPAKQLPPQQQAFKALLDNLNLDATHATAWWKAVCEARR